MGSNHKSFCSRLGHAVAGGGADGSHQMGIAGVLHSELQHIGCADFNRAEIQGQRRNHDLGGLRFLNSQGQADVGPVGNWGSATEDIGLVIVVAADVAIAVAYGCVLRCTG